MHLSSQKEAPSFSRTPKDKDIKIFSLSFLHAR